MYRLILLFAAAALLCKGRSAIVKSHEELFAELDNHIEHKAVRSRASFQEILSALMRKPPAITTIDAGTTSEIKCEAFASPAPSIHWFRDDAPVYQHGLKFNEIIDVNPTSLARITSTLLVPRSAPTAKYTCLVVAGSRSSRASSVIVNSAGPTDLTERSKLVPLAPRILVSYKVYVDNMGTTVILPCHTRGRPRPNVVWLNENNIRVENNPRMKVLKSGELVISSLRWEDMGEYICRASNMFGTAIAKTFIYPAQPSKTNG